MPKVRPETKTVGAALCGRPSQLETKNRDERAAAEGPPLQFWQVNSEAGAFADLGSDGHFSAVKQGKVFDDRES